MSKHAKKASEFLGHIQSNPKLKRSAKQGGKKLRQAIRKRVRGGRGRR